MDDASEDHFKAVHDGVSVHCWAQQTEESNSSRGGSSTPQRQSLSRRRVRLADCHRCHSRVAPAPMHRCSCRHGLHRTAVSIRKRPLGGIASMEPRMNGSEVSHERADGNNTLM